jgi:hypothetical protein
MTTRRNERKTVMKTQFHNLARRIARSVTRRTALKTFAIGLGVLLALTLMMLTPVFGGSGTTNSYTCRLLPVGDEPRASGVVKMTVTYGTYSGTYRDTITCKGLTPHTTYELWAGNDTYMRLRGTQVTDSQKSVQFLIGGNFGDNLYTAKPHQFELYRVEPTGNVLVLAGEF